MSVSRGSSVDDIERATSTPVKNDMGKKFVQCSVKLLDGQVLRFNIERKHKAQAIIDRVMDHLNIAEKEFFGIYFAYHNQRVFLNPFKSSVQQLVEPKAFQWVLHFGVKYYVPEPHYIKDEHTRELFCLQIQQDLKEKRIVLDPTSAQAVNLVALTLQSKLGDYSDSDHRHGYSRPYFKFLFENENAIPSSVEESVVARHKELVGKLPVDCDYEFLNISRTLNRYGKHLFDVEEFMEDRYVEVGANYNGVSVYYQKKLATDYPWNRVNKLLFHGRKFKVRYHPTDDPEEVRSHKFVTMETKLAVPGTPPLPRVLPQLNRDAKYRFSGRTLQQMIKRPESSPKSPELVVSPAPPVHSEDHWVPPRTPSPVVGVNVGHYVRTVSVDVSTGTKPVNHSHAVSMISFPYDYSPSPQLQYRIVIRDGRKIFNKVLSDPPSTPPVPSYRLKWTYIRTSDLEESNKLESGVAVIQTQEKQGGHKRPVNVVAVSPLPNEDKQPSDYGNIHNSGHYTSTESLEDIIDKEMRKKQHHEALEAQV